MTTMYRKACPNCGRVVTSASRAEIMVEEVCQDCGASLPVVPEEYDPELEAMQQPVEPQFPAASVVPEIQTETAEPAELELVLPDTGIVVGLPRPGGMVGRVPVNCNSIKTFATISRIQFAYVYLDGGGIKITDKSQFGTVVNGALLMPGESCAATTPSTVEMGGAYAFMLREREQE